MIKQQPTTAMLVTSLSVGVLFGCSEVSTDHIIQGETYSFTGVYANQQNADLLQFENGKVTIIKGKGLDFTKPFNVEDNHLTIQMRNSSKEKREDIVMRIHNPNLLTCSVCAKYQLSSTWHKKDISSLAEN